MSRNIDEIITAYGQDTGDIVSSSKARAELAALRARVDAADSMPQKIVDLVKQLPPIDQDDVDCISRSIVINQIEKLVNRKLDDDSLWFSGDEWQKALEDEAAPYRAEVKRLNAENADQAETIRLLECEIDGLKQAVHEVSPPISAFEAIAKWMDTQEDTPC